MRFSGVMLCLTFLLSSEALGQTTLGPWYVLKPLERAEERENFTKLSESIGASTELLEAGASGPDFSVEIESPARGRASASPRWQALTSLEDDQGVIDLAAGLPEGHATEARAFLYRTVQFAGTEPAEITLHCGSDDQLRVWWNGTLEHETRFVRTNVPGEDELRVTVQPGINHLLCEVSQAAGAWTFQMFHARGRVERERSSLQTDINKAIDRGVDWLLRSQRLDGSWSYKIQEYLGGQTALSLYTLLKSGLGPEHPSIQRGLEFLSVSPSASVYDTSCRMMLSGALGDAAARERLELHKEQLLDWQSGGFAYPEVPTTVPDLSNTQYAALGLTAAGNAGGVVPPKDWKSLAKYVLSCRNDDGGFCYRPGMASTGAMTAAGVATSALCLRVLGEDTRRNKRTAADLDEAIQGGLNWLGRHFRTDLNPEPAVAKYGNTRWRNYYLYGLERVGAITGTKLLGKRDWYWSGAHALVKEQKEVGNWASAYGEALPNTCFALLFLQKATQTLTGKAERDAKKALGDDDSQRDASLRGSRKDGKFTLWISSFGDLARESYERENEKGRGLRVSQVEYFDRFGEEERKVAVVEGDPTQPSGTERWPVIVELKEPGVHILTAQITLEDGSILRTQEVRVQADSVLEPWMLAYASSRREDLALPGKKKFERSSLTKSYPAKYAFDGLQATSWLCAAEDQERKLTLQLTKAVKATRVLFTVAVPKPIEPEWCARPTAIELRWNGKREAVRIDLDPNPSRKTEFIFERSLPIRSLEVRIVDLVEGKTEKTACGFAEIELR